MVPSPSPENSNDADQSASSVPPAELQEAEALLHKMVEMAIGAALPPATAAPTREPILPKGSTQDSIPDQSDLQRANLRYRSLVEQIPVVTFMAGMDGSTHELYVSPQIETLLGFTQEEWLQNPFLWYNQLHPDDREDWQKAFGQTCTTGVNFRSDYRFIARDGRIVWVHGECQVIRDEQGQPLFLQGIAYDITYAKRAEEALQQISHDLEVKVQERTQGSTRPTTRCWAEIAERQRLESALEERAQQLLEEGQRKDHFLAILAHELRNPLSPITMALEMLPDQATSPEDRKWAMSVIGRQVKQMTRLIEDLLDVSRIGRGKIELRKERICLQTIIEQAIQSTRPTMNERKHTLNIELGSDPIWLDADAVRIEQVIVNLLTNSAKYTEPGGQIWIAAHAEADEVVLRVRDNGIGIPPKMLDQIFELFTQVDRTVSRTSQWGLGIGLALVRGLVELHGGSIEARSEGPGKGSEFVVRLPCVHSHVSMPLPIPATEPQESAALPLQVLVVEDQPDSANLLSRLLSKWGHQVRVAHDGPTAIELCQQSRPDVVLLDVGLPGMDGYQVARKLRSLPGFQQIRLFAVTGYGREEDLQRQRGWL